MSSDEKHAHHHPPSGKKDLSQCFDRDNVPMCFQFKGWGHMSDNCLTKMIRSKSGSSGTDIKIPDTINGIQHDKLKLDCGAQHTAVHPDLVREDSYLNEYLLVQVADGRRICCPMARINLQIAGK